MMRFLLGVLFLAAVAFGQVTTGTILGNVTDTTGASVAGATVTITEVNKNTVTRSMTDESGAFNAPFLVPSRR